MKKIVLGNKPIKNLIKEVAELADYLWQKGWAERNAGNISVNITEMFTQLEFNEIEKYPVFKLPKAYKELANGYFFVTGTGKRMRDLARNPYKNACIIRLSENGDSYTLFSRAKNQFYELRPTSELPAHLAIHQLMKQRNSNNKVVIHTHPNDLVALTHSSLYKQEDVLNKILWGMHPETLIVVPKGVGVVPYEVPGTTAIADLTVKSLEKHDVVLWEKHGCLAVGEEIFPTFDLIDTLSKSAQIFFMCKSAGIEPEGLTQEHLEDLKKAFKL